MGVPAEEVYKRSAFRLPGVRPLTDDDASGMVGHEVEVSLGGVAMCSGTITSARAVDDGANLWVVVESGGRSCAVCGRVYPLEDAASALRPVSAYRQAAARLGPDWREAYDDLPDRTPVCASYDTCHSRRTGTTPEA